MPLCRKGHPEYPAGKRCRICSKARRTKASPERQRRSHLHAKFKMTPEQYDEMLAAQGGVCAVCGALPGTRRHHVDHDWKCCPGRKSCGKCIRGILCLQCNGSLGRVEKFQSQFDAYLSSAPQSRWGTED